MRRFAPLRALLIDANVRNGPKPSVLHPRMGVRSTPASRQSPPSNQSSLQCQLPISGQPPLTTAVEPSLSSSLGDGCCPEGDLCPGSRIYRSRPVGPADLLRNFAAPCSTARRRQVLTLRLFASLAYGISRLEAYVSFASPKIHMHR
jgi:hypothetical protein